MMGLQQFFGVLTALDCSDDLVTMWIVGFVLGGFSLWVAQLLLKKWD